MVSFEVMKYQLCPANREITTSNVLGRSVTEAHYWFSVGKDLTQHGKLSVGKNITSWYNDVRLPDPEHWTEFIF